MKLRTVLPMLAVATFALAACAPKVSFEEFKKKADEAAEKAKEVSYSKVVVDGYVEDDGEKQSFDKVTVKVDKGSFVPTNVLHVDEIAVAAFLNVSTAAGVAALGEDENTTYYAGGSFKVETVEDGKKNTANFNEYGFLTSITGDSSKLTVSYTK